MLPKPVLFVALLAVSVRAQYGVAGMYENLPLESTTVEASGEGSGYNPANDGGFVSGADAVAIDTDCSIKEDGLYAIGGCSPQFLTCSGGIARIMDCPANLIYDPRIVACEYSYNVPECGGVPQDVASTQSYNSVETTPVEEVTATAQTTVNPYAPVDVETTPAEDVTVPAETTVYPYAPVEVETTTSPAEDVTVPVETTVNPYAPVEVETTTAPAQDVTVPEATTVYPYAPVVSYTTVAPANEEPVTRTLLDKTCNGKADGFYSFGQCSDHYIACSNGYTIPMQCPAKLAFDEARVICDYVMNVPECQNGSGNDEGSAEETTTEASGELPYSNGNGYEETTTVSEDVPSTEAYSPVTTADAYVAPYGIESTTAADVPTTTVDYTPEVVEETTTPVYVEETTTAADVPTTVPYVPEVVETTTVPYVEETTTVEVTYPPVTETTTLPYVEETTTAADVPTTTVPYVEETTTLEETTTTQYVEETTIVEETTTLPYEPETTTTVGYVPEVVETTTVEETTSAADVPTTTVEVTTEQSYKVSTDAPSCVEGASAIEPCSQNYRNCVNGHESVFICESGLFFSPEQGRCTTADQIAECHQPSQY